MDRVRGMVEFTAEWPQPEIDTYSWAEAGETCKSSGSPRRCLSFWLAINQIKIEIPAAQMGRDPSPSRSPSPSQRPESE